jgi:hypothetical protein
MKRQTKNGIAPLILMSMTLALITAGAAQTVSYDDFKSHRIDPSKWIGGQNYDPDLRETTRAIAREDENRGLHLAQTAYSSTVDDVGGSGGVFGLNFAVPDAINETAFSVVVNQAKIVGCDSNDSLAVTDAEFRGNFFNTEGSPTSQIGNVVAVIDVERSASDHGRSLTVAGFYSRCDDQFCATSTLLDYRALGKVLPGKVSKVRIKWDQPNHQFIFQLNGEAEVVSPYVVSDSSQPVTPYKAIELARVVPHCTATPRPFATIDATFRNVEINE